MTSLRAAASAGAAGEGGGTPLMLDEQTVQLHQKYHDQTIQYTMENMDWLNTKAYGTDSTLDEKQQALVARLARARLFRWPRLDARDMHEAPLGPVPQRFASGPAAAVAGDPRENVFVISLPRRPSKLRHALLQLQSAGVSATIVDAVDGDALRCKGDIAALGVQPLPGYVDGHKNHRLHLTTGEVGCFMSHYTIWHHMVEHAIPSALILEDDFDFQEDFARRLGQRLEEAEGEDWNLMYVGRSPVEPDLRSITENLVEPGYALWTVGYIIRLDAAQALVEASVASRMAPLDDYFSVAMGRINLEYNENALEWSRHIPQVFRPLAITPPLVMPYVGSMFLSDTAMLRNGTRYVKDLPDAAEVGAAES